MKFQDKIRQHKACEELYQDSDGWWCNLKDGYHFFGCTAIHEQTLTKILSSLKSIGFDTAKSTEHMKQLLDKLNACNAAKEWSKGKTFEEVLNTCHRGDWLLWLFVRTNPADRRLLFLAKGMCAETVIHLMKDQRSIDAVNAAKNYGLGLINEEELKVFAAAAAAFYDADSAAYAAADDDADSAAYAAAAAADDDADSDSAAAANRMKTADICRSLFKIELWNI